MVIDRKRVREEFASYTRKYDPEDPKIALKIAHTYRVADNCEAIAKSLNMSEEDVDFAWLSGMLHDVGRFEQVRRYNTFNDAKSVDHAWLSADLLFGKELLIAGYAGDREMDAVGRENNPEIKAFDAKMDTVIKQHNKYRIEEGISGDTLVFCNILRDADKVDILRVNVEMPREEIFNIKEEIILSSGVTEEVMEYVREHKAVNRSVITTPAGHIIGHIALAFELVYKKSWELAKEQGYIYKMFDFPTTNETTKKALEETKRELETYQSQREWG